MARGFLGLVGGQRDPDSLRRVVPRSAVPHGDLATRAERERALVRYTENAIEANGEWWLPALRLAAARGLGEASGSPLELLGPELLERCAAELFCAGGATIPWVRGRCERVPQARMAASLASLGTHPSLLTDAEAHDLDVRGFVNLGKILSSAELEACRQRLGALFVAVTFY